MPRSTNDAAVRPAEQDDAPYVQALLEELGYRADLAWVQARIASAQGSSTDGVFVAEREARVAGVVSLHAFDLFHQPGRLGRITSLVVTADSRRSGVGAALVRAADTFFREAGCIRVEVTSGDHRPDAHAFYQSQGFVSDERRFVKPYNR